MWLDRSVRVQARHFIVNDARRGASSKPDCGEIGNAARYPLG